VTRAQAVELLKAVGSREALALAVVVERGPVVVDEFTAKRVERLIQEAYVSVVGP
jgi:hypothetical protein